MSGLHVARRHGIVYVGQRLGRVHNVVSRRGGHKGGRHIQPRTGGGGVACAHCCCQLDRRTNNGAGGKRVLAWPGYHLDLDGSLVCVISNDRLTVLSDLLGNMFVFLAIGLEFLQRQP